MTNRKSASPTDATELPKSHSEEDEDFSDELGPSPGSPAQRRVSFLNKLVRRGISGFKRRITKYMFGHVYPWYYARCAKKPLHKDSVYFVEPASKTLSNSLERLYVSLHNCYEYDARLLLIGHLRTRFLKKIVENLGIIKELATAEYIFIANSFPLINVCLLRPETKLIQTWHGCGAFKKFGFSIKTASNESIDNYRLFKLHSNYTHVLVSGDEAVAPYADAMNLGHRKEIIHPIGVSRTDVFWDEGVREAAFEKLYDLYPSLRDKKILFYCPTYRGKISRARSPKDLDIALLASCIDTNQYALVIKQHPFVKRKMIIPEGLEDFAVDVSKDMTVDEMIFVSDVCISDYSSVVFEFSLFERPIIFFTPDLDDYYSYRGFYYPFEEFVCGPICKSTQDLAVSINSLERFDISAVTDFKSRFMNGCDGNSTQRILELIFGDHLNEMSKGGLSCE